MKSHSPTVFAAALLIALAPARAPAVSPPTDPLWLAPVRAEPVGDDVLAGIAGKYYGADMLVGVRIDLLTTLATAGGGTAQASGALYIRRTGTGFEVQVDSRTQATAGVDAADAGGATTIGGDALTVQGIGQVTQIAGDGNRMGNLAVIRFVGDLPQPQGFNGATAAQSQDGTLVATVQFDGIGMQLGATNGSATVGQTVTPGGQASGSILQFGRVAGNGYDASNMLQLQVITSAMSAVSLQQSGVQQALLAMGGLPR